MAYDDALFQLGMDLTRSSTAQEEDLFANTRDDVCDDRKDFFVERDGVRISHTIDPRTGRPISHNLASVSVIHASCMTADGLATALSVLGPDVGYELAEQRGIPAYFLVRVAEDEYEQRQTSVWTSLIENSSSAGTVDQE